MWASDKHNQFLKERYKSAQKAFDKSVALEKKSYYKREQDTLLSYLSNNPRQFWKNISDIGVNSIRKNVKDMPTSVLTASGGIVAGKSQILNTWKLYFSNLLNTNSNSNSNPPPSHYNPHPALVFASSCLNESFVLEEVDTALLKLNSKSAPGPDDIMVSFLKNPLCASFLCQLFNKCLGAGKVPFPWLQSIIKPIPKPGGNPLDPSDYRGISLQSVVTKVLCCTLNARLSDYLETNKLLVEEQNGFRVGRSCQDHIFSLHNLVHGRKAQGLDTFAVFIDFRKAFDSVNRQLLWNKLQINFGISGPFLELLKGLYSQVSSCVKINGDFSDWFEIDAGVKQGCILSPLLFSMYINDLVLDIKSLNLGIPIDLELLTALLYADDVVVFAQNPTDLQSILNCIDLWCNKWGISINHQKTKALHFRHARKSRCDVSLFIGSKCIEFCHQYKYLGYWINEHLNLSESLQKVFDRAYKALGLIIAKSKSLGGFPFSVFSKLYNVSVIPIFNYIAHIWAFTPSPVCTKIQNIALRFFFGLGKNSPIAALIGDTGWPPIFLHLQYTLLKYWYHLGSLELDRIPKKIYCWNKKIAERGKKTWAFRLGQLLDSTSTSIRFDCRESFCDSAWSALADQYLTSWRNEVSGEEARISASGGRLVIYRVLKSIPFCESYVRAGLSVGVRRVMAGLRAGCLPLQVELGRYTLPKTPYELRICKLCNTEVETQEHFLIRCFPLKEVRKKLFECILVDNPNFLSVPDQVKCIILLDPKKSIYSVCKLIFSLYVLRNNLLY